MQGDITPDRSISRILSSGNLGSRLGDHLSGTHVSMRLVRPTRSLRVRAAPHPPKADYAPAWPCSWWGLPGRPHCCGRRWSLTLVHAEHEPGKMRSILPAFSPLLGESRDWRVESNGTRFLNISLSSLKSPLSIPAVCFCGPIRQVIRVHTRCGPASPPRVLPGTVLHGVRTFLDSDWRSRDHPTNLG